MALVVNTNTASLTSQMYVNQTNKDMADAMARLSSGKRINTAADDAAGVAIASRLSSEIRGTNQAVRNALDAQGLINTAEGAHKEIETILQRMRELAVQSANDTNDSTDRTNLDAEMQQLVEEIDRISGVTTWAGQNLLDGSNVSGFNFQIGSRTNPEDVLNVKINSVSAAALGVSGSGGTAPSVVSTSMGANTTFNASIDGSTLEVTSAASGQGVVEFQAETAAVNEEQVLTFTKANSTYYVLKDSDGNEIGSYTSDTDATLEEIATGLSGGTDGAGATVEVTANSAGTGLSLKWADSLNKGLATLEVSSGIIDTVTNSTSEVVSLATNGTPAFSTSATDGYSLKVTTSDNSVVELSAASGGSGYTNLAALVDAFQDDEDYESAGFTIAAGTDALEITFNDVDGPHSASLAFGLSSTVTATPVQDGAPRQDQVDAQLAVTKENLILKIGGDDFSIEIDTVDDSSEEQQAALIATSLNANSEFSTKYTATAVGAHVTFSGPNSSFSVSDRDGATAAISAIDDAISTVNKQRANLGAYSNRLDNTVSNLSNIAINLEDGRSRIEDADFAAESANLAKNQILLQAGTAMLAQANASKQNVLSLLG